MSTQKARSVAINRVKEPFLHTKRNFCETASSRAQRKIVLDLLGGDSSLRNELFSTLKILRILSSFGRHLFYLRVPSSNFPGFKTRKIEHTDPLFAKTNKERDCAGLFPPPPPSSITILLRTPFGGDARQIEPDAS